ncbi:MAG: aldehyde-activating protein [Rhodobacteraceae bacterium]|nr:MAG: aldehyde-activating protein [Paracoccaceae bacterium]
MKGGCLCGAVTYMIDGPLRPVVSCHCAQCRKTSGHYVAATSAARDQITIVGQVQWYKSSETARRGFCPTCGSNLFWDGAGANMSIHAGTLDGATGLQTRGHIYVADKGDYYEIAGDLPQVPQFDLVMTTMVK